jgi:uncharacterized protein YgfB (UPF0149 family)
VDYAACTDALARAEADVSAAEFHGTLCALLCTRPDVRLDDWLSEIVTCEHPPEGRAWSRALREAGERSRRAFDDGEFELELLLPGDEAALAERSAALADWCAGFLFGLGTSGGRVTESLSDDAREVVSDLAEFTRIEPEEEDSETAERALSEIAEYVRMGVMLIYEELMRTEAGAPGRTRLH